MALELDDAMLKNLTEMSQAAEKRFMSKIERRSDGCWIWLGGRYQPKKSSGQKREGYGLFYYRKKSVSAHRWAYQHFKETWLSANETLDHLCRNTLCVRPDHLEVVSQVENTERMLLFKQLASENKRLRDYITSTGFDLNRVLDGSLIDSLRKARDVA